jgi:hypothetical protein
MYKSVLHARFETLDNFRELSNPDGPIGITPIVDLIAS